MRTKLDLTSIYVRSVPTERQKPCDGFQWVHIDASKVFVDLWVHIFLVIDCIHQNDYQRKVLFLGFD